MTTEADLYAPVKALLEGQGYVVKGEVRGCDLVAVRGDEPAVIVELKLAFNLGLVLQGIDRLAMTDSVYLAVGAWPKRLRDVKKLCRRLGLGMMVVSTGQVDILLDPLPYQPRKNARRTHRLLGEHVKRVGDPNRGGSTTRQPMMTAYRQEALRCAATLAAHGPMSPAALRDASDAPRAGAILRADHYGWFERIDHALYGLTPAGRRGLEQFQWPAASPITPVAVIPKARAAKARKAKGAAPARLDSPA